MLLTKVEISKISTRHVLKILPGKKNLSLFREEDNKKSKDLLSIYAMPLSVLDTSVTISGTLRVRAPFRPGDIFYHT